MSDRLSVAAGCATLCVSGGCVIELTVHGALLDEESAVSFAQHAHSSFSRLTVDKLLPGPAGSLMRRFSSRTGPCRSLSSSSFSAAMLRSRNSKLIGWDHEENEPSSHHRLATSRHDGSCRRRRVKPVKTIRRGHKPRRTASHTANFDRRFVSTAEKWCLDSRCSFN